MLFEWNEVKRRRNLARHGIDFSMAEDFDWGGALRFEDERFVYGEIRYVAIGFIENRLHVCIYTNRNSKRRIISLRKANSREIKLHENEIEALD